MSKVTGRILVGSGIALAIISLFLPWSNVSLGYVYLSFDNLGIYFSGLGTMIGACSSLSGIYAISCVLWTLTPIFFILAIFFSCFGFKYGDAAIAGGIFLLLTSGSIIFFMALSYILNVSRIGLYLCLLASVPLFIGKYFLTKGEGEA
ncbi:MAG: hypothetical protein ACFFD2_07850 [Promethearchaeota archaeon]